MFQVVKVVLIILLLILIFYNTFKLTVGGITLFVITVAKNDSSIVGNVTQSLQEGYDKTGSNETATDADTYAIFSYGATLTKYYCALLLVWLASAITALCSAYCNHFWPMAVYGVAEVVNCLVILFGTGILFFLDILDFVILVPLFLYLREVQKVVKNGVV
ncbi:hypothetical protein HDE_04880 [Halotydeus destructor]|nr:hypothetical protein HDE_04880 [Halotydeus destructor]